MQKGKQLPDLYMCPTKNAWVMPQKGAPMGSYVPISVTKKPRGISLIEPLVLPQLGCGEHLSLVRGVHLSPARFRTNMFQKIATDPYPTKAYKSHQEWTCFAQSIQTKNPVVGIIKISSAGKTEHQETVLKSPSPLHVRLSEDPKELRYNNMLNETRCPN